MCTHTYTYTSCLPAKLDALTRSCETVCRPLFRAVLSSTLLYLYRGRNASVSSPCLEMTCAASTLKPFLTICCASHPSPAGISSSKTRREVKVRLDRVLDTRSKLEKNFVLEIDRSRLKQILPNILLRISHSSRRKGKLRGMKWWLARLGRDISR